MEANQTFTPKNAPKTLRSIAEDIAVHFADLIDEEEYAILLTESEPKYAGNATAQYNARKSYLADIIQPRLTSEQCQKIVDVLYDQLDESLGARDSSEYYSEQVNDIYLSTLCELNLVEADNE